MARYRIRLRPDGLWAALGEAMAGPRWPVTWKKFEVQRRSFLSWSTIGQTDSPTEFHDLVRKDMLRRDGEERDRQTYPEYVNVWHCAGPHGYACAVCASLAAGNTDEIHVIEPSTLHN